MLAEERFNRILNIVEEKKSVTVTELTELLDTSESTIRRDLTTLDKRKKLIKVHGARRQFDMEYMNKRLFGFCETGFEQRREDKDWKVRSRIDQKR